jgi:hypothetical protein
MMVILPEKNLSGKSQTPSKGRMRIFNGEESVKYTS